MQAFKLVRMRKDGTLGSLFINRRSVMPVGEWMEALDCPTKGYAHRKGWHCLFKPVAPHLTTKGRVWVEVEVEDYETFKRPISQGGEWLLCNKMKVVRVIA